MKKVLCAAFVVILFAVLASFVAGYAEGNAKSGEELEEGDSFFFGAYEQDYDLKDDKLLYEVEPIEWIVIKKEPDKALLLSRYALDCAPYNETRVNKTWSESSVRTYLNGRFKNQCFSSSEKAAILKTQVSNANEVNKEWNTMGGTNTEDYLFLLSYKEAFDSIPFLRDKDRRITSATVFAEKLGADTILSKNVDWWLRSPGKKQDEACVVDAYGSEYNPWVNNSDTGIRPALWLDLNADFSTFDYEAYERVHDAFIARNYTEVIEDPLCDLLTKNFIRNNYRDLKYLWMESKIRDALIHSDVDDDFENYLFYEVFQLSDDDTWFYDLFDVTDSCYESAKDCMNLGNYERAITLLTHIGVYKDSMKLLRECMDKTHIQWSFLTKRIGSTVNAGLDTGYSATKEIKEGDPHFGWHLGRFMISGFTEQRNDNNIPLFYKTPGDNLVLWFDLEQDIDELNRDESLFVASDTNGHDQQFQIPKSNFGRGALIVQYTDAKNQDSLPQIYVDFLVADRKTSTSRVEIKEEGVYRVALDYEVGKKGKFIVADTTDYNDYRIYFTFEVRNGSNMFFLFDLFTGSALDDYSVTENGFRIDVMRSRSLSVEYTRYVINQNATALDARKDAITARDAEFDKEGYYEITATNTETGKKLTKHIFVGDAAALEAYKKVDPSTMAKFG